MTMPRVLRPMILVPLGFLLAAGTAWPCSTFLLKSQNLRLVGHNLDERSHVPGLVFINKRGLVKTAVSWASLVSGRADAGPGLTWTSKYASVTFNPFGRDFPDDGMNEAGLFIGEMSLGSSTFPANEGKPKIFMSLWMQYVLDTCASVGEAVEAASAFAIDGWGWHFFAADRSGASATLEFLDGALVVHAGPTLPAPVLCNTAYAVEAAALPGWREKAAAAPALLDGKDMPRFAQAAIMLERYPAAAPAVDYAFDILRRLERGGTQWSFVCDLVNLKAWFKSAGSGKIKSVEMKAFRPDCGDTAKFVDLHADAAGDAAALFRDHSEDAGRSFARQALAAILKISPGFEKMVESLGGTMDGLIERFAVYPGRTTCAK